MAEIPTDCPKCGHRADAHLGGEEPCRLPGCPCPIGR